MDDSSTVRPAPSDIRITSAPARDCLVVLTAIEGVPARRFELEPGKITTIGRDAYSIVRLNDESVSRLHASIARIGDSWQLEDNHSSNGTQVNGVPISGPVLLTNGDRIKAGGVILKLLAGDDVEAEFFALVGRMNNFDPLTNAYTSSYLSQVNQAELKRMDIEGSPFTVARFDIDNFREMNDRLGSPKGDEIIVEVCRIARSLLRTQDLIARHHGAGFAVVFRGDDGAEASRMFEEFRVRLRSPIVIGESSEERVTISVGIAPVRSQDVVDRDALVTAGHLVNRASRHGGDRVLVLGQRSERIDTEPSALVTMAREGDFSGILLIGLAAPVPPEHLTGWFRELQRAVDDAIGGDEPSASWRGTYIAIGIRREKDRRQAFVDQVSKTYRGPRTQSANDKRKHGLAVAFIGRDELPGVGDAALDVLTDRLRSQRAVDVNDAYDRLPSPIASAYLTILAHAEHSQGRLTALAWFIECCVVFAASLEISSLWQVAPGSRDAVASILKADFSNARPVALGGWRSVAFELAKLIRRDDIDVGPSIRKLVDGLVFNNKETPLAASLRESVPIRNKSVGHGAPVFDQSDSDAEKKMWSLVPDLIKWMGALAGNKLVTVRDTRNDDEAEARYTMYDHTGALVHPLTIDRVTDLRLVANWCYYLDGDRPPLLLAPFVFSASCDQCQTREVALVRGISFAPSRIDGVASVTNHRFPLPAVPKRIAAIGLAW